MVRLVFKQANALFVFLCALPAVLSIQWECVECCDWCVFVCVCVCSETLPLLSWAGLFLPLSLSLWVSVCVCASVSLLHPVTHFLLTRSFLSLFTSPLNVCLFPPPPFFSLSPPTGAVCIPARRGGGVCDPGSIRTRPPPLPSWCSPSPSPPPWENGCTLLPGRAPAPLWVCCQPWQQRLNMICLSAAACLHQTRAPTPHYSCRRSRGLVS